MADYYVDPSDGGADAGTEANPYRTMAQAAAVVAAGETVYLRNTETLAASVTLTTAGSEAAGRIKWVGCPTDSWVPDGTTFKLNVNDAATRGISINVAYQWFENIEIYDSTATGFDATSIGDYCVYVNCIAYSCDTSGFDCAGSTSHWHRCVSYGNGVNGFNGIEADNFFDLCVAYDNTDNGFVVANTHVEFLRCIAHDNGASAGDAGFALDMFCRTVNCVANSEVNGVEINDANCCVLACRLTNNTNGIVIAAAGDTSYYGYNVFANSATADVDDSGVDTQTLTITTDTNEIDPDGAAVDGYNDDTTEDFNLLTSKKYNGDGTDTVGLGVG